MSPRFLGFLYLALAMVMVGSTVIASKLITTGLPPFTATALRFAIAYPLFLLLMKKTGATWPKLTRRDWLLLVIQAGAGSVGYTTLLISGLRFTSAADAGVIIGTLPVVAAAIAIIVLGERPTSALLLAVTMAAIGVFILGDRNTGAGSHAWIGNMLIFAAVCCEGLFILLNKRLSVAIDPLVLSTIMSGLGLIVAALPALLEHIWYTAPGNTWRNAVDTTALLAVLYYALIPTIAGFILWYAGAARVSGTEASLFTALAPVSAVFFSALLLHEPVTIRQMLGIGCVLAAVISLACLRPRRIDRQESQ